jgi:uncharacterized protein YggE
MKILIRAAALSALLACTAAPAALAQAAPPAAESMFRATTLNLAAYGETRIAPDMATISLGVMTEGRTAAAAMQANATRMAQVVEALRRGGIAAKDIQTSGLNLNPQYVYEQNVPPKLSGYQASNQVTITVHDLARLGQVVDATVGAGANQVNGISFGLDDPTAAENAAREAAVKALSAKAELYARATGHRISRLVTLSEGAASYPVPPPMPMMAMQRMEKSADTSVSPGELKVRVDVTGLYELTR